MSNQFATEQLLELLLQLKKTTPEAARKILNERPPIAYALITLMVSMNAINFDVFQKTLSDFGAASAQAAQATMPAPAPLSAIPPYLQPSSQPNSRTNTPPMQNRYQNQPYGYPPAPTPPNAGYGRAPPAATGYGGGFNPAPPVGYGQPAPRVPDPLAAIPEDQRQMIMTVLAMTPEQINSLSPSDRANIMQLRATLGFPPT
ncbi:hypothetical protein DFH07DRAFT_1063185 [Mycena maculata]|uniref:Cleavage stimulation factor subunit 2 hinge domain-containing protein n=1 Tax=Mycena maculata TaxID=230809 RepID=A0AAD7N4N3_9AGAR|nr:hypothetical protein DFH07DRAFT_1063185 [Mycena maculata]